MKRRANDRQQHKGTDVLHYPLCAQRWMILRRSSCSCLMGSSAKKHFGGFFCQKICFLCNILLCNRMKLGTVIRNGLFVFTVIPSQHYSIYASLFYGRCSKHFHIDLDIDWEGSGCWLTLRRATCCKPDARLQKHVKNTINVTHTKVTEFVLNISQRETEG